MVQLSALETSPLVSEHFLVVVCQRWAEAHEMNTTQAWVDLTTFLHGAGMLTNDEGLGSDLLFLNAVAWKRRDAVFAEWVVNHA